jgi:molybdopterin synthase catalytic subunit
VLAGLRISSQRSSASLCGENIKLRRRRKVWLARRVIFLAVYLNKKNSLDTSYRKRIMIDIQIKDKPISVQECTDLVSSASTGGTTIFVGTVRDSTNGKPVLRLEFEAYEPMAISEMRKIAEQAKLKWKADKIAIHHRVGVLEIKEIAVIIAVSTPHRKAAFEACQYCIDTLKETVPIWKKEIFEDGEVWVAAHP